MFANVILPLAMLTALYGAAIVGAIWLLRRVGLPIRPAIALGFLGFGVATACLAAWAWPVDSSVYLNVWAVLLGDWLYQYTSGLVGDPWFLEVPKVYVLAAVILYGGLGVLVQGIYAHVRAGSEGRAESLDDPAGHEDF